MSRWTGPGDADVRDQYLRTKEENERLKKQINEQDTKIQLLATKMSRLSQQQDPQQQRLNGGGGSNGGGVLSAAGRSNGAANGGGGGRRAAALEDHVFELESQLREQKLANDKLVKKMVELKRAATAERPGSRYAHVQPRIDTGMKRLLPLTGGRAQHPPPSASQRMLMMSRASAAADYHESGPPTPRGPSADQMLTMILSDPGVSLLEAGADAASLEELAGLLVQRLLDAQHDATRHLRMADAAREETQRLQQQLAQAQRDLDAQRDEVRKVAAEAAAQRAALTPRANKQDLHLQEVAALQKEVRDKHGRLSQLQQRLADADAEMHALKEAHGQLLEHTATINNALKEERRRNVQLEAESKSNGATALAVRDLNQTLDDVRAEKARLEEAHRRLRATLQDQLHDKDVAFETERAQYKEQLRVLLDRVNQQDAQQTATLQQLKDTYAQFDTLRGEGEKLRAEKSAISMQLLQLQQAHEEQAAKLAFFTSESGVELPEIQQALAYVRLKKSGGAGALLELEPRERTELEQLRAAHADLVHEQAKLVKMLKLQESINADYKALAAESRTELERLRTEYEHKLDDEARLLDIKNERIRKLEAQLNNYIFNRIKQTSVSGAAGGGGAGGADGDGYEQLGEARADALALEADAGQPLEPDQVVLEFEVLSAALSEGQRAGLLPQDVDTPFDTFVTVDMLDFETVVSPVVSGPKPFYNLAARFVVRLDDFVLHYFKHYPVPLVLCQAHGLDYRPVAVAHLSLSSLLDRPPGNGGKAKLFGQAELVSVQDESTPLGQLQYSLRLHRSIAEEVRAWKTRLATLAVADPAAAGLAQPQGAGGGDSSSRLLRHALGGGVLPGLGVPSNELVVKVAACRKLKPRDPAESPAVFAMYEFYEYPPHDTAIVPGFEPVFNDETQYTVLLTGELEEYLMTQRLAVCVFDDADVRGDFSFGAAHVPLLPLVHDRPITGEFVIKNAAGEETGVVAVELYWRRPYIRLARRPPPGQQQQQQLALPPASATAAARDSFLAANRRPNRPSALQDDDAEEQLEVITLATPAPRTQLPRPAAASRSSSSDSIDDRRGAAAAVVDVADTPTAAAPPASSARQHQQQPVQPQRDRRRGASSPDGSASESGSRSGSSRSPSRSPPRDRDRRRRERHGADGRHEDGALLDSAADRRQQESEAEQAESDPAPQQPLGIDAENTFAPEGTPPEQCVTIAVEQLQLEPLLVAQEELGEAVFVSYEFLRYPAAELETPPLPKSTLLVYNFTRRFPLAPNRYALRTLLQSDARSEAAVVFDVMTERPLPDDPQQVQCVQIGVCEVNLHSMREFNQDLVHERLPVLDRNQQPIGTLQVSLSAVRALSALLDPTPAAAAARTADEKRLSAAASISSSSSSSSSAEAAAPSATARRGAGSLSGLGSAAASSSAPSVAAAEPRKKPASAAAAAAPPAARLGPLGPPPPFASGAKPSQMIDALRRRENEAAASYAAAEAPASSAAADDDDDAWSASSAASSYSERDSRR